MLRSPRRESGGDVGNLRPNKSTSHSSKPPETPKVSALELQDTPEVTLTPPSPCRYKVERGMAIDMCPPDGALAGMLRLQNNLVELELRIIDQRSTLLTMKTSNTINEAPIVRFAMPDGGMVCATGNETASEMGETQPVALNVDEPDNIKTVLISEPPTIDAIETESVHVSSRQTPEPDDIPGRKSITSSMYDNSCTQLVNMFGHQCRAHYDRHANQKRVLDKAYAEIDAQNIIAEDETSMLQKCVIDSGDQQATTRRRLKLFNPLGM